LVVVLLSGTQNTEVKRANKGRIAGQVQSAGKMIPAETSASLRQNMRIFAGFNESGFTQPALIEYPRNESGRGNDDCSARNRSERFVPEVGSNRKKTAPGAFNQLERTATRDAVPQRYGRERNLCRIVHWTCLRPGICFTSTLAAWNAGPQEVTIQAWN
jgi:hypothetical protein